MGGNKTVLKSIYYNMKILRIEPDVKKSVYRNSGALSELLGDFNPKTLVVVGFKLAYRPENYFGVFNCVFHLNIWALNGDWIDYEL